MDTNTRAQPQTVSTRKMDRDERTEFIVSHFSGMLSLMDHLYRSGMLSKAEAGEVLGDAYEIATDLRAVLTLADTITNEVDVHIRPNGKTLFEEKLRQRVAKFREHTARISSRVCGSMVIGEVKTKVETKLAEFRKHRRRHLKVVDEGGEESAS